MIAGTKKQKKDQTEQRSPYQSLDTMSILFQYINALAESVCGR